MSDTINNLTNQINELRQAIKETEFQKQKELHELVTNHRQEKVDLEHNYEEKVTNHSYGDKTVMSWVDVISSVVSC